MELAAPGLVGTNGIHRSTKGSDKFLQSRCLGTGGTGRDILNTESGRGGMGQRMRPFSVLFLNSCSGWMESTGVFMDPAEHFLPFLHCCSYFEMGHSGLYRHQKFEIIK